MRRKLKPYFLILILALALGPALPALGEHRQLVAEGAAEGWFTAAALGEGLCLSSPYGETAYVLPQGQVSALATRQGKAQGGALIALADGIYRLPRGSDGLTQVLDHQGQPGQGALPLAVPGETAADWADWYIASAGFNGDSGLLFMQRLSVSSYDQWLMRYDGATGQAEARKLKGSRDFSVYAYRGEEFLTLRYNAKDFSQTLCVYSWAKAEDTRELWRFPSGESPKGLCYDPAGDAVYYMLGADLMRLPLGSAPEKVGELPYETQLSKGVLLSSRHYVAAGQGNLVYLYDLEAGSALEKLTIWGGSSQEPGCQAFLAAHPQAAVSFTELPAESALFAQKLITGEVNWDLLCLSTGYYDLARLIDKGWWQELSGSAVLAQEAARLYPQIAACVTRDGRLCAWPARLTLVQALSYREEGPLPEPLPETFDQWLALLLDWPEALWEAKPLEGSDPQAALLEMYFRRYEGEARLRGETPDYSSPQVPAALARLARAAQSIEAWSNGDGQQPYLFCLDTPPFGSRVLPLPLGQGAPLYGELTVYLINPASPNQALALAYLEACAQHLAAPEQITLFDGPHLPVEMADYAQRLADLQGERTALETRLELTEDAGKRREAEEALAKNTRALQRLEAQRYRYTAQDIAYYQAQIAPRLAFLPPSLFAPTPQGDGEVERLVRRYLQGQLDAAALSREVSRMAQMAARENGG